MVVQSAAESVYSGLGQGEVLQKQATNGAILGCAGVDGRPSGVLPMKITLQYHEQARRVYYGAVFEAKKEIPVIKFRRQANHATLSHPEHRPSFSSTECTCR